MSVIFNDFELSTLGVCGEPVLQFAPFEVDAEELQSANGSKFIGNRLAAGHVEFSITLTGTAEERRVKMSKLASWLNVDEPKELVLPDSPGWSYLAIPDAGISFERHIDGEIGTVSFMLTDPIAYGEEISITISSGSSRTVLVGGTASTFPVISSSAAYRNGTTLSWGLKVDDGDYINMPFSTRGSKSVYIDCGKRYSTVNNAIVLPTIDSDWFELTPGVHTIANHNGTGACTVTWRERWL